MVTRAVNFEESLMENLGFAGWEYIGIGYDKRALGISHMKDKTIQPFLTLYKIISTYF